MKQIIIDASNATLGRLASFTAKQSLLGKSVIIVNCNNAVLSGNRANIINEYNQARQRGSSSLGGPFFPKHPSRILKRTIRGMLAYKQGRGLDAFKRIKCYDTTPEEFIASKKILAGKEKRIPTITLQELSREI